jgi:NADH dehydrogenase [ubiquinone] 1 alpha subcomplex assembly factor 5
MSPPCIFNRSLLRRHRMRAKHMQDGHDFLFRAGGELITEQLEDQTKTFALAVELGYRHGYIPYPEGKIGTFIAADLTPLTAPYPMPFVVADDEWLPFAEASIDLITTNLNLHWVNDLPGTLIQIYRCLKPGGLFLATLFGGETLHELRASLLDYSINQNKGLSPRVSPFADIKDMGGLLQRAGFHNPVADSNTLTVDYNDISQLFYDLKSMGEQNCLTTQSSYLMTPQELKGITETYTRLFKKDDDTIPASFEIISLVGWKA